MIRFYVASLGGGKWHIATKKLDGWPSTVCGRFGFNIDMSWPEYRLEMPPGGEMCSGCYKAAEHVANVGGAGYQYPVSSSRLGTGKRRY